MFEGMRTSTATRGEIHEKLRGSKLALSRVLYPAPHTRCELAPTVASVLRAVLAVVVHSVSHCPTGDWPSVIVRYVWAWRFATSTALPCALTRAIASVKGAPLALSCAVAALGTLNTNLVVPAFFRSANSIVDP